MEGKDPKEILAEASIYDLAGWRDHFKQRRAVLLVVDAQNDVLDERGNLAFWQVWRHARENGAVENVRRMVQGCRRAGIPVIWAAQYRLAEGRDVFPGTFDGDMLHLIRTLIPDAFLQGTWQTEIYGPLQGEIDPADLVIGKHGSSLFEGTALEKYLRTLGAEVLLVTGFLTDFCVEATVRSACDRGYLAVTVGDACATENERIHRKALERLERMIGPVVSTGEMLRLLEAYQGPPLPKEPRRFDPAAVATKMGEGISLNDIVDWGRYVSLDRTALLVIDPQNDNLHEKGSLGFLGAWRHARETGTVENVKRLVEACRARGVPVFWIKQNRLPGCRHVFPGTFDARVMDLVHQVLPGAFCGGTWDTELYEELAPLVREDEIVLEKAGWDAFTGTPLLRYLNALGVTTLIACGFLTDFCVEATVRSASDKGFLTLVASDACAAACREDHEMALARFDRLIGPVLTTETLVRFLEVAGGKGGGG